MFSYSQEENVFETVFKSGCKVEISVDFGHDSSLEILKVSSRDFLEKITGKI